MNMQPESRSRIGTKAVGILAALFVLLKLSFSFTVKFPRNLPDDDGLFARQAQALLNVRDLSSGWLGAYDNLTLVKGPIYPLWIAVNKCLGMPLSLAEQLLYVAACALFTLAVRPLVRSQAAR